jgi:hypothetical protein
MVQRGPTLVMSLPTWLAMVPYKEGGPPAEIVDRISASLPNALALALNVGMTQASEAADRYE